MLLHLRTYLRNVQYVQSVRRPPAEPSINLKKIRAYAVAHLSHLSLIMTELGERKRQAASVRFTLTITTK